MHLTIPETGRCRKTKTCIMHTCIIRLTLQANGLQAMHKLWARVPYTLHKHAHTKDGVRVQNTVVVVVTQSSEPTHCTTSTTMLKRDLGTGDLCDNIGLVGVSAKWSYVTASPSHHHQAIPILSPLHVGHPYIPLFKIQRIFDLLV